MKRLFLAIPSKQTVELNNLIEKLKNSLKNDTIKWVNAQQVHLTLKFFGNILDGNIPPIVNSISVGLEKWKYTFLVNLESVGFFGNKNSPKVIWVGVSNPSEISQLYNNITGALKKINIYPDRENFIPHFTIGRVKKIYDKQNFLKVINEYKEAKITNFIVDEIILFESILKIEGPVYKPIHIFKLTSA